MKIILSFCLLAIITLSVNAQQDITKQKEEYCILTASPRFASEDKVNIEIDLGSKIKLLNYTPQQIINEQDSLNKFHSPVDALNYMAKKGWVLASSYVVSPSNNSMVYHFVMRRPTVVSN